MARALWRPSHAELLVPFAESYLDNLPTLDRGGMIPAMVFTHWLLPTFGVDEAFLDRAQQVADAGAAPVVRKGLVERGDELRRMLRARAS